MGEGGGAVGGDGKGQKGNVVEGAKGDKQGEREDEDVAQWFGRGGVEAAGYHSYTNRLTFMGSRTIGLGGAYTGFGSYALGC